MADSDTGNATFAKKAPSDLFAKAATGKPPSKALVKASHRPGEKRLHLPWAFSNLDLSSDAMCGELLDGFVCSQFLLDASLAQDFVQIC